MKKVYLIEQFWDGDYRCYEDFSDALKYAIEQIEDTNKTCSEVGVDILERKVESLMELVTSMANRDTEKWGKGFAIDDFLYCWEINLFEKETNIEKEI